MALKPFCSHTQITVYFFIIKTKWLRQLVWAWPRFTEGKLIQRPCSTTGAHISELWVLRGPISGVHNLKKFLFAILTKTYCHGPKNKKQNNKQTKNQLGELTVSFMEIMQVKNNHDCSFSIVDMYGGRSKRKKYCLNKTHLWEP